MARSSGRAAEADKIRQLEEKAASKTAAVRRTSIRTVAAIAVVVAGLIAAVIFSPDPPGILYADLGNFHLSSIGETHTPYNSSPPSSGPHFGSIAAWTDHEDPVPAELFVHNLEDGGIVLTHSCAGSCGEVTDGMRATLDGFAGENVMMTAYPDIRDPEGVERLGAVVAWTRVYYFDDWSSDTQKNVRNFIRLFEGIDNHVSTNTGNRN
jgi:hypothetical protein